MSGTQTTLQPPSGLATPNPAGPDQPPLFCLFTQDWLTLQTYIVQALQLPITQGDFVSKYGTFSDETEVQGCVSAMQAVQGLSVQFGDPATLFQDLASNPGILDQATPPAALYEHIVWLAAQINGAASTFTGTLSSFMQLLNPANCGDPTSCAAVLTDVLTGAGGLQSTAQDAQTKTEALIQQFAAFNQSMVAPNQTLQTYTADSGQFYKDAVAAAGQDAADVTTYQNDADAAYTEWKDYTISAVATSVGITVLSGGLLWPVGAALGGGLGYAASKARDSYNTYCAERDAASADELKKHQLMTDLSGFNTQITSVSAASASFLLTLQQVAGAWATIGTSLAYIVNNYTPAQLGSFSWVNQVLALDNATKDWQQIGTAAQQYTQNSLVSFNFQQFGTPLAA